MKILPLGYGHVVLVDEIVSIHEFNTSPLRRLANEADKKFKSIDATCGRKTRSMVVTKSNHFILCAVDSVTLTKRLACIMEIDTIKLVDIINRLKEAEKEGDGVGE